jgi:hypothetical protein
MIRAAAATAALCALGAAWAAAQAPAATPAAVQRAVGEVTGLDGALRQITLKTDGGETVTVRTDEKTAFLRAQPGARDLAGATPLTLADVAVGDRVLARGAMPPDQKALTARQVVVMARADIAQKHEQDQAEWRRRGLSGLITAIDPSRQEFTVEVRSLAASQTVTVAAGEGRPAFKRYAPSSVRFSDARPSAFADLRVGDQVRVLGNRSGDGARVTAEQVVSGSFQMVSGAVKAVEGGAVTLVENETGRPITVTVGPDAIVRRLPPDMAARLAMRSRGPGGPGGPGAPGGTATRPQGAGPAGSGPGGWQGRRGAGGPPQAGGPGAGIPGGPGGAQTLQDLLERLPPLPLGELKPGDQVAVSSTKPDDASRINAVVLVAGIEPLLQARPRGAAGGGETLGLTPGALDMDMGVE